MIICAYFWGVKEAPKTVFAGNSNGVDWALPSGNKINKEEVYIFHAGGGGGGATIVLTTALLLLTSFKG